MRKGDYIYSEVNNTYTYHIARRYFYGVMATDNERTGAICQLLGLALSVMLIRTLTSFALRDVYKLISIME